MAVELKKIRLADGERVGAVPANTLDVWLGRGYVLVPDEDDEDGTAAYADQGTVASDTDDTVDYEI